MDAITGPFPAQAPHLAHLPFPALQQIIGRALMDPDYQTRLLNGGRQEIAATGSLSDRERVILLSAQATTLADLAKAILDQYPSAESFLTTAVPLAYCG
jgi:hypothetical protein